MKSQNPDEENGSQHIDDEDQPPTTKESKISKFVSGLKNKFKRKEKESKPTSPRPEEEINSLSSKEKVSPQPEKKSFLSRAFKWIRNKFKRKKNDTAPRTSPNIGNESNEDEDVTVKSEAEKNSERSSYELFPDDLKLIASSATPVKIVDADNQEIIREDIIVAPDGGWGWMVTFGSFFSNFVVDGLCFSHGIYFGAIMESFAEAGISVSVTEVGWIISLLNGCYALGGPIAAALANRYGFRVVATMGSLTAAIGFSMTYILCRSTPNLYVMYVFNGIIAGLGLSLMYVPSVIAVGFYFEKHRALATGIAVCGAGVGQSVFGTVVYYSLSWFGWKVSLVLEAFIFLLVSLSATLYRPLEAPNHSTKEKKATLENLTSSLNINAVPEPLEETSVMSIHSKEVGDRAALQAISNQTMKKSTRIGNTMLEFDKLGNRVLRNNSTDLSTVNSPLFRDDIFLRGTMNRVPAYAKTVDIGVLSSSDWSVIVTNEKINLDDKKQKCHGKFAKSLHLLFKGSLLCRPTFQVLILFASLTSLGLFIPYSFLEGISLQNNQGPADVPIFFTVMGAASTLGRIICGVIADLPKIKPEILLGIALCIAGASTVVLPFFMTYWMFILYSVLFGFSIAFFFSLLSVVLVDLIGLDNLTNAFGLLGMFVGIAAIVGTPFAGFLVASTGNYDLSFYVAGSIIIMSGLVVLTARLVHRCEKKRV